jgi:hypothetical protein
MEPAMPNKTAAIRRQALAAHTKAKAVVPTDALWLEARKASRPST